MTAAPRGKTRPRRNRLRIQVRALKSPVITRSTAQPGGEPRAAPPAPADVSMDDRLRRMEEAYLRMEENSRRIQSQYDTLLKKYDDLNRKVADEKPAEATAATHARTAGRNASRVRVNRLAGSPGAQLGEMLGIEPPGADQELVNVSPLLPDPDPMQQPSGGRGHRRPHRHRSAVGPPALGRRGRDRPRQPPEQPLSGPESAPFTSRMDRIGAGAEGTGGRTSPSQQPAGVVTGPSPRRERRTPAQRWCAEGEEGEGGGIVNLKPKRHKGSIAFGEGLEFTSDDGEFKLQFHNLTQAEFRGFPRTDQGDLHDQFFIPRQRWYFTGDLTKNVEFYTVINRGYGSLDLLDAFITLRFDERRPLANRPDEDPVPLRVFLDRRRRPDRPRAVDLRRQHGAQSPGRLHVPRRAVQEPDQLCHRASYNGPRRSFGDFNSAKDIIGNVTMPALPQSEQFEALKYLNIGGSWDWGYENNFPPQPIFFETANDQTASGTGASALADVLRLNSNAKELGERSAVGGARRLVLQELLRSAEYGGVRGATAW